MKLNAKKFNKSSAKFLPNRIGQNQPNPEPRTKPNRNFGRFLVPYTLKFRDLRSSVRFEVPCGNHNTPRFGYSLHAGASALQEDGLIGIPSLSLRQCQHAPRIYCRQEVSDDGAGRLSILIW